MRQLKIGVWVDIEEGENPPPFGGKWTKVNGLYLCPCRECEYSTMYTHPKLRHLWRQVTVTDETLRWQPS